MDLNQIKEIAAHGESNVIEFKKSTGVLQAAYVKTEHNKYVIVITNAAGNHIPYTYDGRPYHRVQSTSPRMPQHLYEQLIVKRGQLRTVQRNLAILKNFGLIESKGRGKVMTWVAGEKPT